MSNDIYDSNGKLVQPPKKGEVVRDVAGKVRAGFISRLKRRNIEEDTRVKEAARDNIAAEVTLREQAQVWENIDRRLEAVDDEEKLRALNAKASVAQRERELNSKANIDKTADLKAETALYNAETERIKAKAARDKALGIDEANDVSQAEKVRQREQERGEVERERVNQRRRNAETMAEDKVAAESAIESQYEQALQQICTGIVGRLLLEDTLSPDEAKEHMTSVNKKQSFVQQYGTEEENNAVADAYKLRQEKLNRM